MKKKDIRRKNLPVQLNVKITESQRKKGPPTKIILGGIFNDIFSCSSTVQTIAFYEKNEILQSRGKDVRILAHLCVQMRLYFICLKLQIGAEC